MLVDDFSYDLPNAAIAQEAIEPRDSSRLLDTSTMRDLVFSDLPTLLNPGDLLVVNETKVRAARLVGTRETGGRTEVLLTRRMDPVRWQAMIRPSRKVARGSTITVGSIAVTLLSDPRDGIATVSLDTPEDAEHAIDQHGVIPLPPYFHGELVNPDRYQTMFATTVGSSAAPTAALHFTPALMTELESMGVGTARVDLEVGLDTFRPMDRGTDGTGIVEDHRIHTEHVSVPPETVSAVALARSHGKRVVAVGTTVVRSLESAATDGRLVVPFSGPTDLFIIPGYRPRVVDAVVTNFHAPSTTLLVLIASLLGDRWREVYQHALDAGYRFLSFGDAMFIEVAR